MALDGQQTRQGKRTESPEMVERTVGRARITRDFGWEEPCDDGPLYVQTVGWARWLDRSGGRRPGEAFVRIRGAFEIVLKGQDAWEWALGKQTVKLIRGFPGRVRLRGGLEGDWGRVGPAEREGGPCSAPSILHLPSRFFGRMSLAEPGDVAVEGLQRVVEGIGTREILTGRQIAHLWECGKKRYFNTCCGSGRLPTRQGTVTLTRRSRREATSSLTRSQR